MIKYINAGQWDKVKIFLHDSAGFSDPFCPEKVAGANKIINVLKKVQEILPGYKYEIINYLYGGENASLELIRSGDKIIRKNKACIVRYKLPEVLLLKLKNDKITSLHGFFNMGST